MKTAEAGRIGEALAERALKKAGMRTLAKNYRFGHCELDLVMQEKQSGTIVFVEVKARSGNMLGLPREAVGPKKQALLRRAAQGFLIEQQMPDAPCRFDVVEVFLDENRIERIENAF